jgi:hypothetical protein
LATACKLLPRARGHGFEVRWGSTMRERRMREELTREKREGCGASRIVESGKPTAKGVRARGAEVACGSFDGSIVASPFGFSVTVDRLWWRDGHSACVGACGE